MKRERGNREFRTKRDTGLFIFFLLKATLEGYIRRIELLQANDIIVT